MMIFSANTSFWIKKVSFDDFYMMTWEQEEKGTTNSATNSHVPDNKPHPTSAVVNTL